MTNVTRILAAANSGDEDASRELFDVLYDELRRMADQQLSSERGGSTTPFTRAK